MSFYQNVAISSQKNEPTKYTGVVGQNHSVVRKKLHGYLEVTTKRKIQVENVSFNKCDIVREILELFLDGGAHTSAEVCEKIGGRYGTNNIRFFRQILGYLSSIAVLRKRKNSDKASEYRMTPGYESLVKDEIRSLDEIRSSLYRI
jgi:hypothetical protein